MDILNIEPKEYSFKAKEILCKIGNYFEVEKYSKKKYDNIEILITRLAYNINNDFIQNFPNLKIIATPTTGLNHINLNKKNKSKISIISLKGEYKFLSSISSTAELHWGLLISLIRKIPQANSHVLENNWNRDKFYATQLKGKTIGIIGYGRLGKMIAKFSKCFGLKTLIYDKNKDSVNKNIKFTELEKLFYQSDIISINLSLDCNSKFLINKKLLSRVKQDVYLINTARGEVIDEFALCEEIKKGTIKGYATDVLCDEIHKDSKFPKNNPLVKLAKQGANIIFTPHIGGACSDVMRNTEVFIAKKITNYIKIQEKNRKNEKKSLCSPYC